MYSTTDFRKGLKIEVEGIPYEIVDFQHFKPGKGGAMVRTKLRNILTGRIQDITFRLYNEKPLDIEIPASLVLEVTETEPGAKGDTVSNVTKPAKLETGIVVQVPIFVNEGDRIKVDTRTKEYLGRE